MGVHPPRQRAKPPLLSPFPGASGRGGGVASSPTSGYPSSANSSRPQLRLRWMQMARWSLPTISERLRSIGEKYRGQSIGKYRGSIGDKYRGQTTSRFLLRRNDPRQASHATPCYRSAPERQAPSPSASVVVCPRYSPRYSSFSSFQFL